MFSFKRILKHVWPSMRPHRFLMASVFIVFGLRVTTDIIRPLFLKKIIDILSTAGIDRAVSGYEAMHVLMIWISLIFMAVVLGRTTSHLNISFEIKVVQRLRSMVFSKIESHSQNFFANTFAGSLVAKSKRFTVGFENMFDILIYNFWNIAIVSIASIVVLFTQSRLLACIFLVWIVINTMLIASLVKKKMRYDLDEAAADSKIGGRLADVFGNILTIKTFSARNKEKASFDEITKEAARASARSWFFNNRINTIQALLVFVTQSFVLYVMIRLWIRNDITTGTVVLVQTYMVILFDRMWDLGNSLVRFMKSAADMQEMVEILEAPRDIIDPAVPEPSCMRKGHIVFDSISFSYPNGKQIFQDFNLNIKPGERVGLVGHSGAGKSTITKLLLRFTDVTGGRITIDGQDVRSVTQDDLRAAISYVPQEPVLFHRTLRENIAYGNPDATIEQVMDAARRAHAHEFIERLEHGYETMVGERGVKLSGGERQRVAIARAILKDAPILLLDEATSALDSHSEHLIQDAFTELMKGKTTIVIAHRLSTIQKMDRIIVLEDGCIAEEGTHADLLQNEGGIYKRMWDLQAGGFIDDGEAEGVY